MARFILRSIPIHPTNDDILQHVARGHGPVRLVEHPEFLEVLDSRVGECEGPMAL